MIVVNVDTELISGRSVYYRNEHNWDLEEEEKKIYKTPTRSPKF